MSILKPLIDRIDKDIEETTQEKQAQIDALVEALQEARKTLVFWTGSDTTQTIGLIDTALKPFKKEPKP